MWHVFPHRILEKEMKVIKHLANYWANPQDWIRIDQSYGSYLLGMPSSTYKYYIQKLVGRGWVEKRDGKNIVRITDRGMMHFNSIGMDLRKELVLPYDYLTWDSVVNPPKNNKPNPMM